jgi:hypothetical protein
MTEKERIAGLAEQIDLAKKHVSEWPDWLRSSAHFAGSNHPSEEVSADVEEPQRAGEPAKRG